MKEVIEELALKLAQASIDLAYANAEKTQLKERVSELEQAKKQLETKEEDK